MTVIKHDDATIELRDMCSLEDAEPLLRYLLASPGAIVEWHACDAAHAAIIQMLLVNKSPVRGRPRGEFLRNMVDPLFSHV